MKKRTNLEIREAITKSGLTQWEVARRLGIGETTFCRMLRTELSDAKKKEVLNAIRTFRA